MTEKINIAELLKDCPKGMELDCSMWNNVVFDHIDTTSNYPIYIKKMGGELEYLTEDGHFNFDCDAKCVIFPKGKTTWEGFVPPYEFKDGDVLAFDDETIVIFKDLYNNTSFHSYCHIEDGIFTISKEDMPDWWRTKGFYPATEEQKAKLFQVIKDNGYKWHEETKTLEKLPKFKVGDKIVKKDIPTECWYVQGVDTVRNSDYFYHIVTTGKIANLHFREQDDWELFTNKFDTNTLKPFESRVLVRNGDRDHWRPAIFGGYAKNKDNEIEYYYALGGTCWRNCISYEGNEHLLSTTDDCDEYFKNW